MIYAIAVLLYLFGFHIAADLCGQADVPIGKAFVASLIWPVVLLAFAVAALLVWFLEEA